MALVIQIHLRGNSNLGGKLKIKCFKNRDEPGFYIIESPDLGFKSKTKIQSLHPRIPILVRWIVSKLALS